MSVLPADIDPPTRNLALLCHAAGLAGCFLPGIAHISGPLSVWLWIRDRDPFIEEHGREAVNFQISMLVYTAIPCLLLALTNNGLFLIPFVLAFFYVLNVAGVLAASVFTRAGKSFYYPFIFRIVR